MKAMEETDLTFLPYGRQHISNEDIEAVVEVLRSDWLTQGPAIAAFESALAQKVGAADAVVCSSGTAALHLTMMALGLGAGDAIVTTPITFLADANCARYVGADVLFADIDRNTGLMDPEALGRRLADDSQRRIKAIIPVHFAGQPAAIEDIYRRAEAHGATVVEDACHALGGSYESDQATALLGSCRHSAMTVFSFHPVKHVACGEGGAITTNDPKLAAKLRTFRNHGIIREGFSNSDMAVNAEGVTNPWYHEQQQLGYNYRLTDIQAVLGLTQLKRLDWSVERRNEIALLYHELIQKRFAPEIVRPLGVRSKTKNAYHLFVVQIDFEALGVLRATVMNRLRTAGIGTQVHYIPVPLQPYYRDHGRTKRGDFPEAEAYYDRALSLPMYPNLLDSDCDRVIESLAAAVGVKA